MTVDLNALLDRFQGLFGRTAELTAQAPGRVNLIGEHTDYNEGFVLPVAINHTVAVAAARRDDGLLRVHSIDFDQSDEFRPEQVRRWAGTRGWRDYVRGVVWALMDSQVMLPGADLVISGDVPRAAGLSSSAAIEVAVGGALSELAQAQLPPERLALIAQKAENVFVGVQCGIMDQLASALGKRGHALLIDCRSLDCTPVALPPDLMIMIVDSRTERNLGDTAYNLRREECARAAMAMSLPSLRDASLERLSDFRPVMEDTLYRRAHHVITEDLRVQEMADALTANNLEAVGRVMAESHASLRDDFAVSTPQLDLLVNLASECAGVIGSRLTGAGFGGCTVNLVRPEAAAEFEQHILIGYESATGIAPAFYRCVASDGLAVNRA